MKQVTMSEFFSYVENWTYDVVEETDRVNGYSYDSYMSDEDGEIGFVSFHSEKETAYHIPE